MLRVLKDAGATLASPQQSTLNLQIQLKVLDPARAFAASVLGQG